MVLNKSNFWFIGCAIFCFLILSAWLTYTKLNDGFSLVNITYPLPYQSEWAISLAPEQEHQLNEILAKPYHYLGKGSQCYAFVSEDGNYVLKFFKFKHLRNIPFFEWLASHGILSEYYQKQTARKQRKLWGVFQSYKLAYDLGREESALLFIQLNTQDNPQRFVTIKDKLGAAYVLNLQEIPFVIQLRADTIGQLFEQLLDQGKLDMVKESISQVFDLYAREYAKGIYDRDHAVMRNIGFVDDQPIHLDVGKLARKPEMEQKKYAKEDALRVANKMDDWIKKHYPKYHAQLTFFIDQKIQTLYD